MLNIVQPDMQMKLYIDVRLHVQMKLNIKRIKA